MDAFAVFLLGLYTLIVFSLGFFTAKLFGGERKVTHVHTWRGRPSIRLLRDDECDDDSELW